MILQLIRVWIITAFFVISGCLITPSFAVSGYGELDERWTNEINEPGSTIQDSTRDILRDRHVVFIGGFINGVARVFSNYYTSFIHTAKNDLEMTASYYGPWSWFSIETNIEWIYHELLRRYEEINRGRVGLKKKLIVMGHSKGGAELFHTLLRHPDLIYKGIVDRVVLVQAAVHGSQLIASDDLKYSIIRYFHRKCPGTNSLRSTVAKELLKRSLILYKRKLRKYCKNGSRRMFRKLHSSISKKIFYVTSYEEQENLSPILKAVLWMYKNGLDGMGENDGILLMREMKCKHIGKDLGPIQAHHTSATTCINVPLLRSILTGSQDEQNALIRAILQLIYE